MASLAGAITALSTLGVVGSATTDYTKTVVSSPRPDNTAYTRLSTWAIPGMNYGDFTGRAAVTEFSFTVPVSIVPVATFGPVTDVDIDITATAVPVLTVSTIVGQAKSVDVSIVPVTTWTLGGLVKTGDVPKASSASIVPVLTVTPSVTVQVGQAVSLIPVLTYTSRTLGISDAKSVAVSIIPAMDVVEQVSIQLGSQSFTRNVDIVPTVTVTASVIAAGDVDRIKTRVWPVGRIKTRIT